MAIRFVGSRLPGSGLLIGDTIVLRHMEIGNDTFSVDDKSVSIKGPNGTLSPDIAVIGGMFTPESPTDSSFPGAPAGAFPGSADSPGIGSNTYIFEAILDNASGGIYDAAWWLTLDGQTIMRRERYIALYNDLHEETRRLMRVEPDNVTDEDIDSAGVQILNSLFGYNQIAAAVGSYSGVPLADVDRFDMAIALMCAAYIRPFTPKQEATGEVTKLVTGTDATSWSAPERSENPLSIEERWIAQAAELLTGTSCLGPLVASIQNVSVAFQATGRRRRQQTPFVFDGIGGLHVNPLFTMWSSWLGIGAGLDWSWKGNGWRL